MGIRRRDVLIGIGGLGAGAVLASAKEFVATGEKKVAAVEDLMREHGVLRRALVIYSETAGRIRNKSKEVLPEAIRKTALLFHNFGEDYHEKKLEEAYIFPALKKAGGSAASYLDTLIAQHNRGREITEYLIASTEHDGLGDPGVLAGLLESFVRMYRPHAAREDTIIFPAWKEALSERELDEMSEKFEDIEQQQFGKDGFGDAVGQITAIEDALGIRDLAQFTSAPITGFADEKL